MEEKQKHPLDNPDIVACFLGYPSFIESSIVKIFIIYTLPLLSLTSIFYRDSAENRFRGQTPDADVIRFVKSHPNYSKYLEEIGEERVPPVVTFQIHRLSLPNCISLLCNPNVSGSEETWKAVAGLNRSFWMEPSNFIKRTFLFSVLVKHRDFFLKKLVTEALTYRLTSTYRNVYRERYERLRSVDWISLALWVEADFLLDEIATKGVFPVRLSAEIAELINSMQILSGYYPFRTPDNHVYTFSSYRFPPSSNGVFLPPSPEEIPVIREVSENDLLSKFTEAVTWLKGNVINRERFYLETKRSISPKEDSLQLARINVEIFGSELPAWMEEPS